MIKLFFIGMLEIFLGVIDFKLTQKNRKILSSIMTVIGIFIWYFVLRTIIEDLNNISKIISYAFGCGFGCYLGMLCDNYIEIKLLKILNKGGRKIKRGKILLNRHKN